MVVEDRKSSFKLNLVLGIAFLLASAFYLVKAVRFPGTVNWLVFALTLSVSLAWFGLSYKNYKKSKEIESKINPRK
jgi:putative effector of murein hydrolase